jgi:type I site-specific restriction endonuclease
MDKGILSKIKIANLLLKYSEDEIVTNKHRTYDEEVRFLVDHPKRNGVFKYIIDHINPEENVLILCYLIDHLKSIKSYLEKTYPNKEIQEIYGEIDADKREEIRLGMEDSKGVILLGTYATMGVGINIKRLHHVIFASSYKSKIKILQSIGRGLRTHESKTKLILWDIVDDLTYVKRTGTIGKNYVYEHFEQRLEYYKTQEFSYINKNIIVKNL